MAQIGVDCHLIIDGNGYFVLPHSYEMSQPRVRKAVVRADGGESYVDLGPGKRVWKMVILCLNDLTRYDGQPTGTTGQGYRDALYGSYTGSTGSTINFTSPLNDASIAIHFDNYIEKVMDIRSQAISIAVGLAPALSYLVAIELVEA